jgi:hypothetical protein
MAIEFKVQREYPEDETIIHWRGTRIVDPHEFDLFLCGPVKSRVADADFTAMIEQDLLALATTDMEVATVREVLAADVQPLDWEIGEAMAECLLEHEFGAHWPWNENRDRKTPRASLPGADLVGLLDDGDETVLLFGEVKTSSDKAVPPGVLSGRGGLIHQIDALAVELKLQRSLLMWLAARCKGTEHSARFESACKRYIQSQGKDIALVGILLRDTAPHQDDLRTRGEKLASTGMPQPRIRLDAWYLPRAIVDWPGLVSAQ